MRTLDEIRRVERMAARGLNASAISRITGIPRSTVRDWLNGRTPDTERGVVALDDLPRAAYSYLFGLYLGDGCLSEYKPGVFRIRIALDSGYPRIIASAVASIRSVMPNNKTSVRKHPHHNVVEVYCYSTQWPKLFPQHGPGRKHHRDIIIEPWQGRILDDHTDQLIRGLIHSDGCRVINRVHGGKYQYPRYQFSNRSADIRAIFTGACEELGITWTRTNRYEVAVSRRDDVALLDSFIGPKA